LKRFTLILEALPANITDALNIALVNHSGEGAPKDLPAILAEHLDESAASEAAKELQSLGATVELLPEETSEPADISGLSLHDLTLELDREIEALKSEGGGAPAQQLPPPETKKPTEAPKFELTFDDAPPPPPPPKQAPVSAKTQTSTPDLSFELTLDPVVPDAVAQPTPSASLTPVHEFTLNLEDEPAPKPQLADPRLAENLVRPNSDSPPPAPPKPDPVQSAKPKVQPNIELDSPARPTEPASEPPSKLDKEVHPNNEVPVVAAVSSGETQQPEPQQVVPGEEKPLRPAFKGPGESAAETADDGEDEESDSDEDWEDGEDDEEEEEEKGRPSAANAAYRRNLFLTGGLGVAALLGLAYFLFAQPADESGVRISGDIVQALLDEQERMIREERNAQDKLRAAPHEKASETFIGNLNLGPFQGEIRFGRYSKGIALDSLRFGEPAREKLAPQQLAKGLSPRPWVKQVTYTPKERVLLSRTYFSEGDALAYVEDDVGSIRTPVKLNLHCVSSGEFDLNCRVRVTNRGLELFENLLVARDEKLGFKIAIAGEFVTQPVSLSGKGR